MIYVVEKRKLEQGDALKETYWSLGGGFLRIFGEKHRRSGKRLVAIKAVQVCCWLLLKLLPVFDFSVCFRFRIFDVVLFGVDAKGHKLFC